MIPPALDDRVKAGLAALDRHAWKESYDLLKAADADGLLGGRELEQLGLAAWWLGRLDDSLETMERAYEASTAAGHHRAAAHVALELARGYAWKSGRCFAPKVRIGLHAAASHQVEDGYHGGRRPHRRQDRRELTLKGIGEPVEVAAIRWR